MARFQRERFQPLPTGGTGEQQLFSTLSQRLESFTARQSESIERDIIAGETAAGKLAGTEEGFKFRDDGSLRSRAFNRGALVSYTAGIEADIQRNISRMEVENTGNPEGYRSAAEAYKDGLMSEIQPFARAPITNSFARANGLADSRVTKQFLVDEREGQIAIYTDGLENKLIQIRNAARNATEDDTAIAEMNASLEDAEVYLEAGLESGFLAPKDVVKFRKQIDEDVTVELVKGDFSRLVTDGGDALGLLKALKQDKIRALNKFDPERRDQLFDSLMSDLNEFQSLETKKTKDEDDARKERYRQGDKIATISLLDGTLSTEDLRIMVETDQISPEKARGLEERSHVKGPAFDNDELKLMLSLSLVEAGEADILDSDQLTNATKAELMLERDKLLADTENWRNTQNGREGARRIMGELGVTQGVLTSLDTEKTKQVSRALSRWFNLVESEELNAREQKAIDISESIISEIKIEEFDKQIARAERSLEEAESRAPEEGDDSFKANEQRRIIESKRRRADRLKSKRTQK